MTTPRKPRQSVQAVQVDSKFRVIKCTNYLDLRAGDMLTKKEAQRLIDKGINFTFSQNK